MARPGQRLPFLLQGRGLCRGDAAEWMLGDGIPGQFLEQPVQFFIPLRILRRCQDGRHRQSHGIDAIDHGKMAVGGQGFQRCRGVAQFDSRVMTFFPWPDPTMPRAASYTTMWSPNCRRERLCLNRIGPIVCALSKQRRPTAGLRPTRSGVGGLGGQVPTVRRRRSEVFNIEVLGRGFATSLGTRGWFASNYATVSFRSVWPSPNWLTAPPGKLGDEKYQQPATRLFLPRRHLGPDYLALLQFFLNHRRFLRSERPERIGKSPAELLTRKGNPHWLEMLGHARFFRT